MEGGTSTDSLKDDSLPVVSSLTGVVKQRSAVIDHLPPPEYILSDPSRSEKVLQLSVEVTDGVPGTPSVPEEQFGPRLRQRCRVWLWGVWCDRLQESVVLNSEITVVGAEVERDHESTERDLSWRLALPPKGASASARVLVSTEKGVFDVTETRVGYTDHGLQLAGQSAAFMAAGRGALDIFGGNEAPSAKRRQCGVLNFATAGDFGAPVSRGTAGHGPGACPGDQRLGGSGYDGGSSGGGVEVGGRKGGETAHGGRHRGGRQTARGGRGGRGAGGRHYHSIRDISLSVGEVNAYGVVIEYAAACCEHRVYGEGTRQQLDCQVVLVQIAGA